MADGTMKIIVISEGVILVQGCNFGTLFFNLGCGSLRVLRPVKDEFEAKGLKALRQLRFAFMTTPQP
jgi:hypothetical protein